MLQLSCTIIGQHPTQFKFGYKEEKALCKKIKSAMLEVFKKLYARGIRKFYIGGALGVDMWAGELLMGLKKEPDYSNLELIIVMPFKGYSDMWEVRDKKRLNTLLDNCSHSFVIGNTSRVENYKRRNYYMIDQADCVLAICDSSRLGHSVIRQTINYARKQELPITFIHPDTAVILPNYSI